MTPTKDFKLPPRKTIITVIAVVAAAIFIMVMANTMQTIVVVRGNGYQSNTYFIFKGNGTVSVCNPGISPDPDTAICRKIGNF